MSARKAEKLERLAKELAAERQRTRARLASRLKLYQATEAPSPRWGMPDPLFEGIQNSEVGGPRPADRPPKGGE